MAQLTSLRLAGWKSIQEAEIELRPLNVLIGANGAGKSNLVSYFKFANRQRIVDPGGCFYRHLITPMNVGRDRHFRRRLVAVPACTARRKQCWGGATGAGGRAGQRVFPQQFVLFPVKQRVPTRGRGQRTDASKRATERREQ